MKTLLCFIALSLFFIASNVSPPEKISFGNDTEQVSDFINIDALCPVEIETIYVSGYAEWSGGTFVGEVITDSYFINQSITYDVTLLNSQFVLSTFRDCLNANSHLINPVARSGTFLGGLMS